MRWAMWRWNAGWWSSSPHQRHLVASGLSSVLLHLTVLIVLACFAFPLGAPWSHDLWLTLGPEPASPIPVQLSLPGASEDASLASDVSRTDLPRTAELYAPLPEPVLESPIAVQPVSVTGLEELLDAPAWSQGRGEGIFGEQAGTGGPSTARRGTSFFGIPAAGNKFVYLLDMSTSMLATNRYGQTRFQLAAAELMRSVSELSDEQQFFVGLFCYQTFFFTIDDDVQSGWITATADHKEQLRAWLSAVVLGPGTDPRLSLMTALQLEPDGIFLLTDGEFNGQRRNLQGLAGNPPVEDVIADHRVENTPIHTVALADRENRGRLVQISLATGGLSRFIEF